MAVWTTPELQELLKITELPLRLLPGKEIRAAFLAQAAPKDIAVLTIDGEYADFLAAAQGRGLAGPFLFIAPEPTLVEDELYRKNALVLDLKKTGSGAVKNIIHVILNQVPQKAGAPALDITPDCITTRNTEDEPIEDADAIRERLVFAHARKVPANISFEVMENGEPIRVRGLCSIKETLDDSLVFHNIRQPALFLGIKTGLPVMLYFSYSRKSHVAMVVIQGMTDKEITTSMPTRLFITRDIRIQPNRSKPVRLYVHIPDEPAYPVQVADISPRGISFLCTRDLPADCVYGLTIILPEPDVVIVTSGAIRFKREGSDHIRYGAEIRPHHLDEESLAKYVLRRETEILNLLVNMG